MSDVTFTKLFSSITDSTIWDESPEVCKVWVTMLAMADRDGHIGASVPGLANRARVSVDVVLKALEKFMAPDPYSRTKDHEGRRIEESERGWRLLNHARFREKLTEEKDRERKRTWARNRRAKTEQDAEENEEADRGDDCRVDGDVDDVDVYSSTVDGVDVDVDEQPLRRRLPSVSASASASGDLKKEEALIPCPPDLELNEAQAANLEMTAGCPRWAQKQIAAKFRGRYLADESDRRTLVVWRKGLNTATASIWSDTKQRPQPPEPEQAAPGANQAAKAAAEARKQVNLDRIARQLDAGTKGAA